MPNADFWSAQRVLLTGHTGFKGSWLSLWLEKLGAETFGFALPPDQTPSLYASVEPVARLSSMIGDLRDPEAVKNAVHTSRPTVVIHMAAQSLVRRSYRKPRETWATNLMGSINLLETLRSSDRLKAVLVVTTDKVYKHFGEEKAFNEQDHLGGHDPYSASKAALEVATESFAQSYFEEAGVPVATARAGNVLGGGDWSEDRLCPDVWRAMKSGKQVLLRYPDATRPWQHVLDPLAGYLQFIEHLASDAAHTPRALNFGPEARGSEMTVKEVVAAFQSHRPDQAGKAAPRLWGEATGPQPKEMPHLRLDIEKAMTSIAWRPALPSAEAIVWTAEWYFRFDRGESARHLVEEQIARFEALS